MSAAPSNRRWLAVGMAIAGLVTVALVVAFTRLPPNSSPSPAPSSSPPTRHAWLIVMENRADTSIINSPSAPYLNNLIARYGVADNYRATVHSSQPNYLALFSGALHGVKGNEVVSITGSNIADQLEAARKTWRVYAQNVPPGCYQGETATGGRDGPGTYARKHEPAISFLDITRSDARCANITDFTAFDPMAADFEFIVPNLENDMHNGTTRQGDDFLQSFVPRILASEAWKSGSPLFITWDEGKPTGDNKVLTLVISNTVQAGHRSTVPHTHYSLLRTIEELLGLPCLAQACHANTLAEFFPGVLSAHASPSREASSGSPTPTPTPPTPTPPKASSPTSQIGDPVILAAGDIATSGYGDSATAALLATQPGTILTLGDNAYQDGSPAQFKAYYDPTWGAFKARTHPVAGNHDYACCAAADGFRSYFGFRPGPLYYSYNVGTWHLVALDAGICWSHQPAACNVGSVQEQWLKADLAAHRNLCTLVYWHQARWSSGATHGSDAKMQAFWADAVAANADVVLVGHDHDYERFAPMDASGASDPNGTREFVVGTGGADLYSFATPLATSQIRHAGGWGVLRLVLHPASYDWTFLSVGGGNFTDTGTSSCH